ncbi:MAG: glycosyltransferase family 9 protein [Candidatus Omnitrophica bacterium]|nr:glycosyltransferase family 9 protein [Candidatus Omnitrophota bacterium]
MLSPCPSFYNILIVRTDRIGDVILTTPAIKALRKSYPMARISVLVAASTQDLVRGNPYLDEIWLDERSGRHKGWIGFLQLARDIRRPQFDAVFIFHTKRRYNLACFLAGVPVRIGYKNEKYGFLLTSGIKDIRFQGKRHEAEYCLDVLKTVGIEDADLDFFVPTDKQAENWATHWLTSNGLSRDEIIAVHAGASDPAKCWPSERFADLINSLHQRTNCKIVLIGSLQTKALSLQITQLCQSAPLDLTGQTSLAQTVSLLRRCRLLISNDSGPVHIAAAVGIGVISLFMRDQPGINPKRWRPLSDKSVYLFHPQGIEVQEVLDSVEKLLHKDHQKFFPW